MPNINEVLFIARKEVNNITRCHNPQEFVNKCLGTDFTNCAESLRWYERHGRTHSIPKKGDQIFVNGNTGIVEMVVGDTVYTIEADINMNSIFFGLLRRKKRSFDEGMYGRPEYESAELVVGPKNIDEVKQWLCDMHAKYNMPNKIINIAKESIGCESDCDFDLFVNAWNAVKRGHLGIQAQVVQAALICSGYSCGKHGANGYFGEDSVEAVKRFQKDNKMICDGIVGKAVATKLFKGITF